jgi:hypothetical protein
MPTPLHHQVLRFLKKLHSTFCVVTHKAQNHCYHAMVIDDWVGHMNRLIVATAYSKHSIINFDKTNISLYLQRRWQYSVNGINSGSTMAPMMAVLAQQSTNNGSGIRGT